MNFQKNTLKYTKIQYESILLNEIESIIITISSLINLVIITAISPLSLEQWQNKLLKSYQPNCVQKFRSILFSIFDKALTNDLIKVNPLSRIKSPLTVKRKFKKLDDNEDSDSLTPFNKSELEMILDNTDDNLYYVIYFMIYTGIRPGS